MPSVLGLAPSSRRRSLVLLIVLLVPLLGTGCGGGSTYSVNEGQIAQRFLPTERSVSHHPDSLRVLSRFQNVGTGRSVQSRTYATFWSLELSLASLQPEMGIQSLQKEKARELIEKRRKEYFDTIQIDVYWFIERSGESGIISGPSARIELQVGDNTYRPLRSDRGPLREAYVSGGNTILYRRNILYFPRTVDGTDILQNAPSMQLEVHRIGTGSVEQFSWRWETEPSA
ncbi:MAG: hypothetical protein BRD30_04435 [Bacteroidetes bacterium QH_2_63_10]|nr:MAG: hypothetical protein BRD30_04435 [Bacteroidetes bacterium QH_2_63_10]